MSKEPITASQCAAVLKDLRRRGRINYLTCTAQLAAELAGVDLLTASQALDLLRDGEEFETRGRRHASRNAARGRSTTGPHRRR